MFGRRQAADSTFQDEIKELPPKERLQALQALKLLAEIKALRRSRILDLAFWRDLIGIFAVAGSVVYAAFNFIDQQRSKQRFEVTREVITLVEKLHGADADERQSAAILLSAWGDQALPILLRSVSAEQSPGASGLAQALELIGRERPALVLKPLQAETGELFKAVKAGRAGAVDPLQNHIQLLGKLSTLGDVEASRKLMRVFARDLGCDPQSSPPALPVSQVDRNAICSLIRITLGKLGEPDEP